MEGATIFIMMGIIYLEHNRDGSFCVVSPSQAAYNADIARGARIGSATGIYHAVLCGVTVSILSIRLRQKLMCLSYKAGIECFQSFCDAV